MNDQDNMHEGQAGEAYQEIPPQRPDASRGGGPQGAARGPQQQSSWSGYREPRKSPVLAALLSLMPGLGQIYVGYYQRGFLHLAVVATLITALSRGHMHGLEPFLGLSLAFVWLYNVIDASRRATRYNMLAEGGSVEELPEFRDDIGSRTAGIILVVLGGLLFAHTKLDIDLDWLEDWWPLALVAFGFHLIRKNRAPDG